MSVKQMAAALLLAMAPALAPAHGVAIGYVSLTETAGGQVQATTKVTRRGRGLPRPLTLAFRPTCSQTGRATLETEPGAVIRRWRLDCPQGLAGTRLRLRGLDVIRPDAVVHLRLADGSERYLRLDRYRPEALLTTEPDGSTARGLGGYFTLGVHHILSGVDHLLFVLGLILVIWRGRRGVRMLLTTVTAFTLAHSLTLGLATLAGVTLPGAAVEATIALSILVLAVELARHERDKALDRPLSLTFRRPWIVAFAFGLLHGFGFAGALARIGLPESARVWALLYFNLGVEAGQLLFIALLAAAWYGLRRVLSPPRAAGFATTVIGAASSFWLIGRLGTIIGF